MQGSGLEPLIRVISPIVSRKSLAAEVIFRQWQMQRQTGLKLHSASMPTSPDTMV